MPTFMMSVEIGPHCTSGFTNEFFIGKADASWLPNYDQYLLHSAVRDSAQMTRTTMGPRRNGTFSQI